MDTQPAISEFVERFGVALEKEGLPRIAGRILGLVTCRADAVLLDDLANELHISRGSASTNTRLLEDLGVLERISIRGDRRVRYRLSDDPYGRFLEATVERIRYRQRIIGDALGRIPEAPEVVQQRFRSMLRFNEMTIDNIHGLLERWRDESAERRENGRSAPERTHRRQVVARGRGSRHRKGA